LILVEHEQEFANLSVRSDIAKKPAVLILALESELDGASRVMV
jgi:hypothetical protein